MINKIKNIFIKNKSNKINIIKTHLTLEEMFQFVNNCVEICFLQDVDGKDIDYSPLWKDIAILNCFAEYYTDYKSSDDIEENYLTYKVLNPWKSKIDLAQFATMMVAIDEKVEYRKAKLLQTQAPLAWLLSEVTNIVKGLGDNFNLDAISDLTKMLGNIEGIDNEKMIKEIVSKSAQNKDNVK